MAILKKRTSSRQLPKARGLDRAPLDSVIRNLNDRPSLTGRTSGSLTSDGSGQRLNQRPSLTTGATTSGGVTLPPVTSTVTSPTAKPTLPTKPPASLTTKTSNVPKTTLAPKTPLTTKPSLTSKTTLPKVTTPTVKPTVKPTVTNKTTTTPTTKTTPTSVVKKPTVTPTKTNTNSTANKVTNALTGAVLGAGTKLIYDKITGKPVVKPPAGGTPKPSAGGTPKPPVGGTPKPPAGGTPKPPAGGTPKPPAGGTKPPVTSKVLTDEEVQAELDRVKASEEAGAPPEGAIDNGDGTYSVTEDGMVTTYNADGTIAGMEAATDTTTADASTDTSGVTNDGVITRGLGSVTGDTTVAEGEGDTTVADTAYYQDDEGNYYTMNDDGGYDLAYYADGSEYTDTYTDDTTVAENTYTDPDTGAEWTMADNGEWTTDFNYDDYYASDDYALADNTDYTDNSDYLYAGNDDYTDYTDYGYEDGGDYFGKRGGLITMMKKGGVPRFEEGGYSDTGEEVQDWQNVNYNYGEYDDPTMTGDDSLYSQSGALNNSYLRNLALDEGEEAVDTSDDFTPVPGRQYFDDGSYIDTFDDGSTMTYDYDGNLVDTTDGYQTTRDEEGNYIVTDGYGNMTVYDPSGSIIPLGGGRVNQRPITNVGSGTKTPPPRTPRNPDVPPAPTGLDSDLLSTITGALGTTAGAAGAGALIASLLGSDFMGGGSGAQNQGLDMSQVGLINPRTTDFGIGPTNFVGYDQYGTDAEDYTPNEELLRNLNAPGYNPVNEGDYGYEDVASEEVAEEVPAMASGGLSSMSTPVASYYTFGQPADILANLGMRPQPPMNPPDMMPQIGQQRPPEQAQQQGLPQQQPPQMAQQMSQGMPQQGMMPQQQGMAPPMRKGGLPHVSNVPLTQGRMDFRKGAAVHGAGDGQSDDIPAMLADGEYVIDAETVAQIGNGSTKAGAQALDKFRESIRAHKRSAPINKIPPKTKALTSYLKGAK
jgi:hypothetical protein